jgi:CxxC motif-containing protein (DUF1111 family)
VLVTNLFRTVGTGLVFLWTAGLYSAAATDVSQLITEAPAGFDSLTNGLVDQATFDADREAFEERDGVADGLGPVYNAQSCGECHQSPLTGGISQITELRAGSLLNGVFSSHPGGSLINDRAIHVDAREYVYDTDNVRTLRTSLNTLGDGFVEAIADQTLLSIAQGQPAFMRGQAIQVDVAEMPGARRVGRFGWKDQHGSLLSFAGDAYLNEQGVTNRLFPDENTSNGASVAAYDAVPDPEDIENDIDRFAEFMRATKAPPRDAVAAATPAAIAGSVVFNAIGCNVCHTRDIVTAAPGTSINGGAFIVPSVLGNKRIHPFSDFLLHDVGTGDGIVQNGPASTRTKLRTPPLWGVRTRGRLMHDGRSLTMTDAVLRHGNEAALVGLAFRGLSDAQTRQLLAFLSSL